MNRDPSIGRIAALLNDRMNELARHLLGQPNPQLSTSAQLRYGTKGSLAIEIDGEKAGRWFDHEQGAGGDALELVCNRLGLDHGGACEWARAWLGLASNKPGDSDAALPEPLYVSSQKIPEEPDVQKTPVPVERAARVAEIVRTCVSTDDTPAERYLRCRGITARLPECLRFRPRAFGRYGALVALATDADGNVLAVQQTCLTDDGRKAPVKVVKRTNKAVDGWSERAAVRLPGTQPVVLAEGVETALSVWQATGRETWACLGISNIARAPLPENAAVTVARDGDAPGSKADGQITRAVTALVRRGYSVSVAAPPEGQDFNDLLLSFGEDAVRALIAGAGPAKAEADAFNARRVMIGSDVEIAGCVKNDLVARFGSVLHDEGQFWRYGKSHWEAIPEHELRLAAHAYDGAYYKTPKGEPGRVKLGKNRVDSILNELITLTTEPQFFTSAPVGINCASGFIRFAADGMSSIEPHRREHRCRHTLPGRWPCSEESRKAGGALLYRLLDGVFFGDSDAEVKNTLLAEVCGSAALGYATRLLQPRAVILKGERAENGKSQILDLARGLLPVSAICSVTAARMGNERHVIGLVGKLLNASDELSSAAAIASETFKAIVTGEPVEGRDVYKSRIEFHPVAQHLFATNNLPPFQGGMDRGVQRRLLVLTFNRVIPLEERVEAIGRRIAAEEADLLLEWAVEGASRIIRQRNFTMPPSSRVALTDWILGADPVLAWLEECVEVKPVMDGFPSVTTREAYEQFRAWAVAEGFRNDKLPAINGFVQRVQANAPGIEHKRTKGGRLFLGLFVKHSPPPPSRFW